jgi:organic hydroperoxide reductase OsmC/OhrA
MHTYTATIEWRRGDSRFTDLRYSRAHRWRFDGGVELAGSSSPHVVPLPYSDASAVDPEEAFVASLSSCHMLAFLYVAAKAGFVVDDYRDEAVGTLAKDGRGRESMTVVTLRPAVRFAGELAPTRAELDALHHAAHEECYIANSVLTDVRCEPVVP